MILQALMRLYDDLVQRGEIARLGWLPAKISFALSIDRDGNLLQVIPQCVQEQQGKKTVLRPRNMELPAAVTRTAGVLPNFLWDHSGYLLGVDAKGKPERSAQCFEACRKLHHQLLDGINEPEARAILAFFDKWKPQAASAHPALADSLEEILKGGNLVFRIDGRFAQDVPAIRAAWEQHYADSEEGTKMPCLVTGNLDVPEAVHPFIKGVAGAQSSGASIVSFNAPAFCSYGKEQSLNAPVGKTAAFAYTAALNHLLADRKNVHRIADTTMVAWAEGAEPEYSDFFNRMCMGQQENTAAPITTDDLRSVVDKLAQGLPCAEMDLDLSRRFYILGLSPNAARLSVRFFYNSTFGELMQNVAAHHKRLEIVGKRFDVIPMWALLRATANQNTADKSPSPVMAGAVARSVFAGTPYPASLLEAVMLRIRAEREITYERAAILKAYYLKNPSSQCPKEVLTVSLNEESTNIPYVLGRLFAVYEQLQEMAISGINATIRDKYFNAASATPAVIFPVLDNLAMKHLRKLEPARRISMERKIGALKARLPEANPTRLSLPEQGSFNLGYYHQKQERYTKKEEK